MTEAWTLSLFDEEPTVYEPKKPRIRTHTGGKMIGRNIRGNDADPNYRPNYEDRPINPIGAPPLDWWLIDD